MCYPAQIKIAGMGRYLPDRVIPSSEVESLCGLPAGWIERKTGVRERRWVGDAEEETNSYMGAQAAREAIKEAGLDIHDIDLILNASGSQEQAIPDGAPLIQRHLGLGSSGVACMSVHATCLGFLVALDLSASLLATGRYRNVLIVAADIASVGINFEEPESASLFGDCAAAAVVTRTPDGESSRILSARIESYGEGAYYTAVRSGGTRKHPLSPKTKPEDCLFHMDGKKVYRLARKYMAPFMEKLRPGLSRGLNGRLKLVIPHQASMFAVKFMAKKLSIPEEKIVLNLDRLGNCIAASIPSALYDAVQGGRMERGDEVLLLGTGAGLTIGGIILTY